MKKLKVGIIGVGGGVAAVHLLAYQDLDCIQVVAGADLNTKALENVSKQWGIKGYVSFEEMLKAETLDIVCICVPARYHRKVAEITATYKVNILIEKPLAGAVEDAEVIIKKCDEEGVKLYYGASYRTLTANMMAREMIINGDLGDVSMAMEVVVGGEGFDYYKECGPHHYEPGEPGGCGMGIMDHGIHLVDLFCWFLNTEVDTVFGRGNISGNTPASEHATITFKGGAVVHLIANTISFPNFLPSEGIFGWGGSWDADGMLSLDPTWSENPVNYHVFGSKGSLRVYPYAEKMFYFSKGVVRPIKLEPRPMPMNFTLQMELFVNSILNNTPPPVTGEDGLKALKIIQAVYQSNESQNVIKM